MSFTTTSTTASAHATCISAVPDKHGYVPPDACGSNYLYYPSYTAAMIFTILFVIATVLHGFQAFKYRKVSLSTIVFRGVLLTDVSDFRDFAGSLSWQAVGKWRLLCSEPSLHVISKIRAFSSFHRSCCYSPHFVSIRSRFLCIFFSDLAVR